MVVRAGDRAVDTDLPDDLAEHIRSGLRMRQNLVPGTVSSPAIQAIRTGLPQSVALRQVALRRTGAQLPQDAVEDRAVIAPLTAALTARWQQGRTDIPRIHGQFPSLHRIATLFCPHPRTRVTHLRSFVRQTLVAGFLHRGKQNPMTATRG